MGRHKIWRKEAKKMRRKRIRQVKAQERDVKSKKEQEFQEQSPRYQALIAEQDALEVFQLEEEARQQVIRHRQWLQNEETAREQYIARIERQALARQERVNQEKLIRVEWEAEQSKLKLIEEEKRKIQEEKIRKQEELMKQIDDFITKGGELPVSVTTSNETNPGKPPCPFFSKTGACRFGDRCSRNHIRPGVSKVLLIPAFYSHFGMSQSMDSEYDTDLMLEYSDSETYQDFEEFYNDVLPEFEEYGDVVQFKVCCNGEPHLRGNVYIEYSSERYAVKAYQKFHGRFYGGRQISVEFTCVSSWKSALCGSWIVDACMFFKNRCPKGRNCNFLHVFRNPGNRFHKANRDLPEFRSQPQRSARSPSACSFNSPSDRGSRSSQRQEERGHWRWSESPPPLHDGRTNGGKERRSSRSNRDTDTSKRDGERSNAKRRNSREREERSSRERGEKSSRERGERSSRERGERSSRESGERSSRSVRNSSSRSSHRKERRRKSRSRS